MTDEPERSMRDVVREDGRYPQEAFAFLHDGLNRAVAHMHDDGASVDVKGAAAGEQKHVTGAQLCLSLRDLAAERWGMLAKTVLARWRIRGTIDFGSMVYLLIDNGFMRKTPEDSLDDFRDVYDFETAFVSADEFELKE